MVRLRENRPPKEADAAAKYYAVPRNGVVASVAVHNRNELRLLRTELELLHRIRQHAGRVREAGVRRATGKCSDADLRELRQVLRDAAHPAVAEAIRLIDGEFADLQEEISMTAVNDEAEKIVQEALEAGAVETGAPAETTEAEGTPAALIAASVEDALATAEAGLAEAAGLVSEVVGEEATPEPAAPEDAPPVTTEPEPEAAPPPAEAATPEPPEDPESPEAAVPDESAEVIPKDVEEALTTMEAGLAAVAGGTPAAPDDQGIPATEEVTEGGEIEEAGTPSDSDAAPVGETAPQAGSPLEPAAEPAPKQEAAGPPAGQAPADKSPPEAAKGPSQAAESTPPTPPRVDLETPPPADQTEQAVAEIEHGIRRLAGVLSAEVNEQWSKAQGALSDILAARTRIDEACRGMQGMVEEIARIKEETAIARAEADAARREARLFRDDAKRAKERTDASAEAAELAANQAREEAEQAIAAGPAPR